MLFATVGLRNHNKEHNKLKTALLSTSQPLILLGMSEDEKAKQKGMAATELDDAKVEYGHLEYKLERTLCAYREAARKLDKANTESGIRIADGKVIFEGWSGAKASDLMNEQELANFLLQYTRARIRVKKATQVTRSLGLTTIK